MKNEKRNDTGDLIFDNSLNKNAIKKRKEFSVQHKENTESIVVLNRQVRRALDRINILESRINELEGTK